MGLMAGYVMSMLMTQQPFYLDLWSLQNSNKKSYFARQTQPLVYSSSIFHLLQLPEMPEIVFWYILTLAFNSSSVMQLLCKSQHCIDSNSTTFCSTFLAHTINSTIVVFGFWSLVVEWSPTRTTAAGNVLQLLQTISENLYLWRLKCLMNVLNYKHYINTLIYLSVCGQSLQSTIVLLYGVVCSTVMTWNCCGTSSGVSCCCPPTPTPAMKSAAWAAFRYCSPCSSQYGTLYTLYLRLVLWTELASPINVCSGWDCISTDFRL